MRDDELFVAAKELQAPYELVKDVAENGKLPVVNFVAGGISTPADAALVMQLGAEGVFVGSGIFKSEDPARMANAIVQATTHFDDPKILADVSKGLGAPMRGIAMEAIPGASGWRFEAGEAGADAARAAFALRSALTHPQVRSRRCSLPPCAGLLSARGIREDRGPRPPG